MPRLIADLDPGARDLEGYLFPETYALPRGTSAAAVVAQMVDGFKNVMTPELRAAATGAGLTVRQLVTLASLVEKETGTPEERPLVAAVYANRMKIGMGMQADPTVIYALQKAGKYTGNLQARRSAVRFALQHLSLSGPAAGPDRRARQGLARGRREARRRRLSIFREQERRFARVRVDARRAQSKRVHLAGGLLPQAAGTLSIAGTSACNSYRRS